MRVGRPQYIALDLSECVAAMAAGGMLAGGGTSVLPRPSSMKTSLNADPITRLGGVNPTGKVPTKFTVDRVAGNDVLQFRDVHDKKP